MTDRIDLDDRVDESEDVDREPSGDPIWRDEDTPPPSSTDQPSERTGRSGDRPGPSADATNEADGSAGGDGEGSTFGAGTGPIPRVPRENESSPVGIPVDTGGAGGSPEGHRDPNRGGTQTTPHSAYDQPSNTGTRPAGGGEPGGGADEMTMAITYRALIRLSNPSGAISDARGWTDWIGVVGDVDTPTISKFQRDEHIDLDFFNGTGTAPGERLAEIGPHSMFYSERMVVVGLPGRDEEVARRAGWEFVPLEEAAAKADWELTEV